MDALAAGDWSSGGFGSGWANSAGLGLSPPASVWGEGTAGTLITVEILTRRFIHRGVWTNPGDVWFKTPPDDTPTSLTAFDNLQITLASGDDVVVIPSMDHVYSSTETNEIRRGYRPSNASAALAWINALKARGGAQAATITWGADSTPTTPPQSEAYRRPQSEAYRRAVRALYPATQVHQCVRITAGARTEFLVQGYEPVTIGEHTYAPAAFRVRVDVAGEQRAPSARLEVDHVGRALVDWLDAAVAAGTAEVVILEIAEGQTAPDWSMTFRVVGVTVGAMTVTANLGLVPVLRQPAVRLRYDPETAPALF